MLADMIYIGMLVAIIGLAGYAIYRIGKLP